MCRRALAAAVGRMCIGVVALPWFRTYPGHHSGALSEMELMAFAAAHFSQCVPPEWPHSDKSVDGFHQARGTTAFRYRRCFRVCIPACQGLLVPGGLFFLALSCYGGTLLLHHLSPQTKVRLAGAAIDAFDTGTYLAAALAACAFCVLV